MRRVVAWTAALGIALSAAYGFSRLVGPTPKEKRHSAGPLGTPASEATEAEGSMVQRGNEPRTPQLASARPQRRDPVRRDPVRRQEPVAAIPTSSAEQEPATQEALREEWSKGEVDEPATKKWSAHFKDALKLLEVDGALDGLSCKGSLCRLDFHFGTMAEAVRFQENAGMPERRKGVGVTVTDEGRVNVEVFMARDDTSAPAQ